MPNLCPSIEEIKQCLAENLLVDNTCVRWLLSRYVEAKARIVELEAAEAAKENDDDQT